MDKKRWDKYKREMKKLGFTSVGYTYNIQQQRNHTATINLGTITDPEAFIAEAKAKLANDAHIKKEAQSRARYSYDYIKRNRHIYDDLFIPSAKKQVEANEPHAEEYLQHCLNECSHFDDGTYLEWRTEKERQDYVEGLHKSIVSWEKIPPRGTQLSDAQTLFSQIMNAAPTKDLLADINGQMFLDITSGNMAPAYARIQF